MYQLIAWLSNYEPANCKLRVGIKWKPIALPHWSKHFWQENNYIIYY